MKSDPVQFALLSLGRCGTTMFQNLINSHPTLYLSEECHWMQGLAGAGLMFQQFAEADSLATKQLPQDSKWWDAVKALNGVLLAEHDDKKCGLQYIGPYNLNNLQALFNSYPDLPVIVLIRDPRALLHSLYRTGIGFPNAGEQLLNCINKLSTFTSNYLVVQYEDFYRSAPAAIEALCKFLGVEQHPDMLKSLANVVSHGESSALNSPKALERWQSNLTAEQLYPLVNQQATIKSLGYPVEPIELDILTAFKPEPGNLASNQITLHWEKTQQHAEGFSTPASGSSIGIVELLSAQTGVTVSYKNKPLSASSHQGNSHLFDLREAPISPLERKKHQNSKNIESLRSIAEELINKQVTLYSAGQETRDFLERNTFIKNICSIKTITDRAPDADVYRCNNETFALIAPHQLAVSC